MNMRQTYQHGITLIELMIAITIGLLMMTVLAILFSESSRSHKALSEASQQIENGRFAIQTLTDDIHMAGFYGRFSNIAAAPAASPDPCAVSSTSTLYDALPLHVQGFNAPDFSSRPSLTSAPLCAAILTNANLQPGSDILVIRRADTQQLTGTPTVNDIYLQANTTDAELQLGVATAVGTTLKANGTAATILNKDGTAAPIRKYHVHVYFIAPCSVPSNGDSTTSCTGASDDGGKSIPTLKRLELSSSGGATVMKIDSLVEGIEMMKIDYGVDNTGSITSGRDGTPDGDYLRIPASLPADWADVMGVNVYLLSRNTKITADISANKTYNMGVSGNYTPCTAANPTIAANPECFYKRHVYSSTIRMTNPSGRREAP